MRVEEEGVRDGGSDIRDEGRGNNNNKGRGERYEGGGRKGEG